MKITRNLLVLLMCCFISICSIGYADIIKVKSDGANVRSEPNSTSSKIGAAAGGHKYVIISEDNGWCQIKLEDGTIGWVSGKMGSITREETKKTIVENTKSDVENVKKDEANSQGVLSAIESDTTTQRGYVISSTNIRKGPGTEYEKIGAIPEKTDVLIYSVSDDGWYEIGFDEDGIIQRGFVSKKKIKPIITMEIYDVVCNLDDIYSGTFLKIAKKLDAVPENGKVTIMYNGYGIYSGEIEKYMRSGDGIFVWMNGDTYEGTWAKDMMNGNGKMVFFDRTVEDGIFKKSRFYAGNISKVQADGSKVYREVVNGKLKQKGRIEWPDGTIIEGNFNRYGILTGKVSITYKGSSTGSTETYVGTVKNGLKVGKGTYTWASGAHYTGDWKDDMMNGSGTYYYTTYEKKDYLRGKFVNNQPTQGMIYVDGKRLRYKTDWLNGKCISVRYAPKSE